MIHEGIFTNKSLYPGSSYPDASCLPSLLKKNIDGTYDYVTEQPANVGDVIVPCWVSGITVSEIIDQRPARGDWQNTSYAGKNVTWQRIRI